MQKETDRSAMDSMVAILEKTIEDRDDTIRTLKKSNTDLNLTIKNLNKTIASLQQEIANLQETLDEFKRKLFGKSSEKTKNLREDPEEMETVEETAGSQEPESSIEVKGHTRTRKKKSVREDLYAALPIREILLRIPEDQKNCPECGTPMVPVGTTFIREELRITPAKVERIRYLQERMICPSCKNNDTTVITEAPVPYALLMHSPASPSVVAYVIYEKYFKYVPLYRQEEDWLQYGIPLPRETTANWCIRCALEYLRPLYERLHEVLLEREIIHADEVPCQVLHEPGKDPSSRSYMWIYLSEEPGKEPIVLYEYQPGRNGDFPKAFLAGFSGYLHCDGYSGYNKVENVTLVNCLAHARRYFFEAIPKTRRAKRKLLDLNSEPVLKQALDAGSDKRIPAEIGFDYCNQLFLIERELKDLEPDQKKEAREQRENSVWEAFWNWIGTLKPAGGSALEKAVNYALNHHDGLTNYMKDGRCDISNNSAERRAKSYVQGRKNFLFHNSVKGAEASAVIYSIIETAKANHLNVYQYLYTLLLYMPDYMKEPAGIEALLPWSTFIQENCTGIIDTETITPENHKSLPLS